VTARVLVPRLRGDDRNLTPPASGHYEFPIVQNPTLRGVFWTTGRNLRSEVLKSFVSNFVPVVFLVESGWPLTGLFEGGVCFCQTSLAGKFSAGEFLT
jgi:hypothetical protein